MTPDITVHLGSLEIKEDPLMLKEKDLKKHLESELKKMENNITVAIDVNMTSSENDENNESQIDETIITQEQLYKDAQLKSAVDILTALIIVNKGKK